MRTIAFLAIILLLGLGIGHCDSAPGPLGVTSRGIGGGALNTYTPGVANGQGLNNIGLLVRMWGKVTYEDTTNNYFYIDDGYGLQDGSTHLDGYGHTIAHIGVRVSYDNLASGETFTPPQNIGDYVGVTGISSTIVINTAVQPNLRPRRGADMVTY